MTKLELINRIAEHDEVASKASAKRILSHITDTILGEVKDGENVNISGFVNFKSKAVEAKSGTALGHTFTTPAHTRMKFKVSAKAKRFVA